ncbi:peptidoglycan bridge formation glycyltransferase FemA/FemB family protein [Patescibacteria group bacterium]|nr:peptidoglycan bridge formation glycyltransferase FemA/FemB family protein [Patescibacteria group bacterium]
MENENSKNWNQFVIENNGSFLQSYEWAEFQKKCGTEAIRIKINGLQAVLIKEKFSFYIPYGPVTKDKEALPLLFAQAKKDCAFLRIEPYTDLDFDFKHFSVKRSQPQKTLILDLKKSEQEILDGFQKTARYNIGLAQRKGVKVLIKDEYNPEFYKILSRTGQKNNFKLHEESHYKNLFDVKSRDFDVKMFLGEYQSKIIAAFIMVLFGNRATALHGSFDTDYKQLKPANLLVWERIKYAKEKGCEVFDFWGIDEKNGLDLLNSKKLLEAKRLNILRQLILFLIL